MPKELSFSRLRLASFALVFAAGAASPTLARAEPAEPPEERDRRLRVEPGTLREAIEKLQSEDPSEIRRAIDTLERGGGPAAARALEAFLYKGQPDAFAHQALEALGAIGQASSAAVLTRFARHRRAQVRRLALEALSHLDESPAQEAALARGLTDPDASVRGAAALSLGRVEAKGALDTLLLAFEREVPEAAVAIGKLAGDDDVARFSKSLGKQPLPVMLSGYEQMLRRNDLSVVTKRKIVTDLAEISGPLVREFLLAYSESMSARERQALGPLVQRTIRRIAP